MKTLHGKPCKVCERSTSPLNICPQHGGILHQLAAVRELDTQAHPGRLQNLIGEDVFRKMRRMVG